VTDLRFPVADDRRALTGHRIPLIDHREAVSDEQAPSLR